MTVNRPQRPWLLQRPPVRMWPPTPLTVPMVSDGFSSCSKQTGEPEGSSQNGFLVAPDPFASDPCTHRIHALSFFIQQKGLVPPRLPPPELDSTAVRAGATGATVEVSLAVAEEPP